VIIFNTVPTNNVHVKDTNMELYIVIIIITLLNMGFGDFISRTAATCTMFQKCIYS